NYKIVKPFFYEIHFTFKQRYFPKEYNLKLQENFLFFFCTSSKMLNSFQSFLNIFGGISNKIEITVKAAKCITKFYLCKLISKINIKEFIRTIIIINTYRHRVIICISYFSVLDSFYDGRSFFVNK